MQLKYDTIFKVIRIIFLEQIMSNLDILLNDIHKCNICKGLIPEPINPVLQVNEKALILIVGQAPGRKVYKSGVLFEDSSGDRLRKWMGISIEDFYDPTKVAILPMAFCYPGSGKNGDLPPRPECADAYRTKLLEFLPNIKLTLVIGKYAQKYHLKETHTTLTELVKNWQNYLPSKLPLPHPSPRNNIWLKKNEWFEKEVIPTLQDRVHAIIHTRE